MRALGGMLVDFAVGAAVAVCALLLLVILVPVACIYRWRVGSWPC